MDDHTSKKGNLRPPIDLLELIAKNALDIARDAIAFHEARLHKPSNGEAKPASLDDLADFIATVVSGLGCAPDFRGALKQAVGTFPGARSLAQGHLSLFGLPAGGQPET